MKADLGLVEFSIKSTGLMNAEIAKISKIYGFEILRKDTFTLLINVKIQIIVGILNTLMCRINVILYLVQNEINFMNVVFEQLLLLDPSQT